MKKQKQHSAPIISGVVFAVILLSFGVAQAHDGHGKKKHRHKHHANQRHQSHQYEPRHSDSYYYEVSHAAPPRRYASEHRYSRPAPRYKEQTHFSVPERMSRRHARKYKNYYYGRSYHRGHDHYHRVYRFPVRLERGWEYRPHAYCDGRFFKIGRFTIHGPVFSLSVGW